MTLPRNITTGSYYHLYNRGYKKQVLFHDTNDWARMLFSILYYQSPARFSNTVRIVRSYTQVDGFDVPNESFSAVMNGRQVELVAFCLMPNHMHLLVRELVQGGISRYMQRVMVGYTMYHHTKYEQKGHVFESVFKSVPVVENDQLVYLSAYIHKNPSELKAWRGKEEHYPWSSLQDYVHENRWGGLLAQEIILDQFDGTSASNYRDYVKTSPAKGQD